MIVAIEAKSRADQHVPPLRSLLTRTAPAGPPDKAARQGMREAMMAFAEAHNAALAQRKH